jgi:release factor glutamine methyltransferase
MPTYREVLMINEQYALDNHKEDSAVKRLLLHFSQMDSAELLLHFDEEMPQEMYNDFLYAVDRYIIKNIPVQHIIGYEYFFGHKFMVNSDVLIPRFETEELVGHTLKLYDDVFDNQEVNVLDVGTGSGCLAVTLSVEEPHMHVDAVDISSEALTVAKHNNETLGGNVRFFLGDLLQPVQGNTYDILISNPPYIPNDEYVEELVKGNEPHLALFGGKDGLDFYRKIVEGAKDVLNERFIIAFEHAYNTSKKIKNMLKKEFPHTEIIQYKDMQGKDRMTFCVKR